MTASTKPTVESLAAMLKSMQENMTTIAGALADLAESQPESQVPSNGTLDYHGLTESTLKSHAKRHGVNIMGKVTQQRIDQWYALYLADQPSNVPQQAARAMESAQQNGDPWADFAPKVRSAESSFGRPKATEAPAMLAGHPERDTVARMSAGNLLAFAQAGKPTATTAKFRNVPLNGNHRRCIGLLARSVGNMPGGQDTPSIRLVVCDAVLIARSANVDPTTR